MSVPAAPATEVQYVAHCLRAAGVCAIRLQDLGFPTEELCQLRTAIRDSLAHGRVEADGRVVGVQQQCSAVQEDARWIAFARELSAALPATALLPGEVHATVPEKAHLRLGWRQASRYHAPPAQIVPGFVASLQLSNNKAGGQHGGSMGFSVGVTAEVQELADLCARNDLELDWNRNPHVPPCVDRERILDLSAVIADSVVYPDYQVGTVFLVGPYTVCFGTTIKCLAVEPQIRCSMPLWTRRNIEDEVDPDFLCGMINDYGHGLPFTIAELYDPFLCCGDEGEGCNVDDALPTAAGEYRGDGDQDDDDDDGQDPYSFVLDPMVIDETHREDDDDDHQDPMVVDKSPESPREDEQTVVDISPTHRHRTVIVLCEGSRLELQRK